MVLLNPRKALFNFQIELFFYFLFHLIGIFNDSHKVYIERQKSCPERWLFCLTQGDLRKRRKNARSLVNEAKYYFAVQRSQSLFKLTFQVCKNWSEILLSPSLEKNQFWRHKMELHSCQLCPRHAQVGLYLLCVYSVTARQMTWFYLCIHTLPLNTSLEYILLLGAAGTNFVAPPINRCPSSFAFLFSCDRLMAQLL